MAWWGALGGLAKTAAAKVGEGAEAYGKKRLQQEKKRFGMGDDDSSGKDSADPNSDIETGGPATGSARRRPRRSSNGR